MGEKVRIKQHTIERNQCVVKSMLSMLQLMFGGQSNENVESQVTGIKNIFSSKNKLSKKYQSFIDTIINMVKKCLLERKPLSHDLTLLAYRLGNILFKFL